MTIVILAAGASRRFGSQKLLAPLDGRPLIAHVLGASAAWPTVVVASRAVADAVREFRPDATVVHNAEPERGMTHSLALANAAIDPDEAIAVLLGDLPACDAVAIARVIDAHDAGADVTVPRAGERFGHPVVFGPAARAKIATLPAGDALHRVRDDPALRRRIVEVSDARAFADVDTPDDLSAHATRMR